MSSYLYYTMQPLRICLAEDDEDDLVLFKHVLDNLKLPFLLFRASNGCDLVRDIQMNVSIHPDYIFLDVDMPQKNGFETLRELRSQLPVETKIFMLSTLSDHYSVQLALSLGANGYISKCIPYSQFSNAISGILQGSFHQPDGCPLLFLLEN
jgi:DNA-binding NarL/FixJ family response regulator